MAVGDQIHVVRSGPKPRRRDGCREPGTDPPARGQPRRAAAGPGPRGRHDRRVGHARRPSPPNSQRAWSGGVWRGFRASARAVPRLVSVGGDGLIKIWDPEAGGEPLRTLDGRAGAVYSVAVRPDGHQIATGGEDGLVRTWDPATGRADLPPLDHGASISALAYDPTGTALASGGMDRTVRVWSATSGRPAPGAAVPPAPAHEPRLQPRRPAPGRRRWRNGRGRQDPDLGCILAARSPPRSSARAGWTP